MIFIYNFEKQKPLKTLRPVYKLIVCLTLFVGSLISLSFSEIALAKHTYFTPSIKSKNIVNKFIDFNTVSIYNQIQKNCVIKINDQLVGLDGFRTHTSNRMFIYSATIKPQASSDELLRARIILDGQMGALNSTESTTFLRGVDLVSFEVLGYHQSLMSKWSDSSSTRSHYLSQYTLSAARRMNNGDKIHLSFSCKNL